MNKLLQTTLIAATGVMTDDISGNLPKTIESGSNI